MRWGKKIGILGLVIIISLIPVFILFNNGLEKSKLAKRELMENLITDLNSLEANIKVEELVHEAEYVGDTVSITYIGNGGFIRSRQAVYDYKFIATWTKNGERKIRYLRELKEALENPVSREYIDKFQESHRELKSDLVLKGIIPVLFLLAVFVIGVITIIRQEM